MRFLEERHVAIVVELLVWSHRMDLLALANCRGIKILFFPLRHP